jgi:tetratricopeptide (TPR) repeat protein
VNRFTAGSNSRRFHGGRNAALTLTLHDGIRRNTFNCNGAIMTLTDSRGNAVTVGSRTALALCEQAIEQFAGYAGDPFARIDAALAEDPGFILPHLVRGAILVSTTERATEPLLRECVEAATALSQRANERERGHLAALRAWLDRDFERSIALYGRLLIDHPRDLLALQLAHLGDFYLGQTSLQRDRVAALLPEWDASLPGFGFVLGMYAFGLEENAHYAAAEETGRRAVDLNPRDVWAIHAVAHVMEMQARQHHGIDWLCSREAHWAPDNAFAFHNWWHLALFHLDLGEHQRVLDLYDRSIRPAQSQVALEMIDASALLWRLRLRGVDAGGRWKPLAEAWEPLIEDGYYAFNDVHAMMAVLGAGHLQAAQRLLQVLEQRAGDDDCNARVTREVGLPVCRALHAFDAGRFAQCIELLMPVRAIAHRFGGSHAQRDLLSLTLVEACIRGGQHRLARALAAERLALRPSSPFNVQLAQRTRTTLQAHELARQAGQGLGFTHSMPA